MVIRFNKKRDEEMSNRLKVILPVVAVLIALTWLYAGSQPSDGAIKLAGDSPTPPPAQSAQAVERTPPSPSAGRFRIAIEDVKPGVAIPVLKATQGDSVSIVVTSDRVGTLEIHGYRQEVSVTPGSETTLSFVATRAGRFPIDLHGSNGAHVEVTALEVQPR
jgi:heme/copper-type cytochrome/quinol oxidase subunit 2